MINKKMATALTVAALLVGSTGIVSAATLGGTVATDGITRGNMPSVVVETKQKREQNADYYQKIATKLGIDTTGMSEEEIKAAVEAKLQEQGENFPSRGMKAEFNFDGLELELPFGRPGRTESTDLSTPEEFQTKMLQQLAERFNIDTTGMSDEEIREAITAAGGRLGNFFSGMDEESSKLMGRAGRLGMNMQSEMFGFDTSEMTAEEIKAALEAMTPEERETRMLQAAATRHGIDPAGMTSEEIKAALEALGISINYREDMQLPDADGMIGRGKGPGKRGDSDNTKSQTPSTSSNTSKTTRTTAPLLTQ